MKLTLENLAVLLVLVALGSGTALAEEIAQVCNPPQICVPEIPAGSAPFLLLGLLGFMLWIKNFFSKK